MRLRMGLTMSLTCGKVGEVGMNEKDFKLIEDNLKSALEYQKTLNQQIMGRLDAYESIVRMTLKILIDAATERR